MNERVRLIQYVKCPQPKPKGVASETWVKKELSPTPFPQLRNKSVNSMLIWIDFKCNKQKFWRNETFWYNEKFWLVIRGKIGFFKFYILFN